MASTVRKIHVKSHDRKGTPHLIDAQVIDDLVARARQVLRRRLNLNLHPQLADPIQRLLNAGGSSTPRFATAIASIAGS